MTTARNLDETIEAVLIFGEPGRNFYLAVLLSINQGLGMLTNISPTTIKVIKKIIRTVK